MKQFIHLILCTALLVALDAVATTYYVATNGVDTNELNILAATLGIATPANGQVGVQLAGEPGHPFVWEQSATLKNWQLLLTNHANASGLLQISTAVSSTQQFFRAAMTQ